tara:strand:- start:45 stop:200 length:156 start_codon:yes stop_codon:yes gene_type:complete
MQGYWHGSKLVGQRLPSAIPQLPEKISSFHEMQRIPLDKEKHHTKNLRVFI